jgi:hypothetical protein
MKALTTFCEQHPLEVVLTPFGLFSAVNENDPLWQNMMDHSDIFAGLDAASAIRTSARCMNWEYNSC